jgi:protein kinase C substrate 80K-H
VSDGVCDYELCCDGSDEWDGVGGVKCENKCKEIGKEWRKHDEERQRSLNAAARKRQELVAEAGRLKKECEDRVQTIKTQIQGTELKVANLEKELEETERREKSKVIKGPREGGKMGVLIGLARQRTEELRNTLESVKSQRDVYNNRLKQLEQVMTTFKEEYNPNFNDEGVKRAVRAWEDYIAQERAPDAEDAKERDLLEILKSDSDNGLNWVEFENDEDDTAVCKLAKSNRRIRGVN